METACSLLVLCRSQTACPTNKSVRTVFFFRPLYFSLEGGGGGESQGPLAGARGLSLDGRAPLGPLPCPRAPRYRYGFVEFVDRHSALTGLTLNGQALGSSVMRVAQSKGAILKNNANANATAIVTQDPSTANLVAMNNQVLPHAPRHPHAPCTATAPPAYSPTGVPLGQAVPLSLITVTQSYTAVGL